MKKSPLKRTSKLARRTGLKRRNPWEPKRTVSGERSGETTKFPASASQRGITRGRNLKKVSRKRAAQNRLRSKITKEMREVDPTCHIKSPVCTGRFDALHEVIKRSASGSIVPGSQKALEQGQVFIRSCNPCNGYIEDNVLWAREKGFAVSRFNNAKATGDSTN